MLLRRCHVGIEAGLLFDVYSEAERHFEALFRGICDGILPNCPERGGSLPKVMLALTSLRADCPESLSDR